VCRTHPHGPLEACAKDLAKLSNASLQAIKNLERGAKVELVTFSTQAVTVLFELKK
jgi:hypothetical protein